MQRAERRSAEREARAVRTLAESDYLLGVADETRLGALRFRWVGKEVFQAPIQTGVPAVIELGRLLQITERILRDEETDDDLQLIFAPGSSLGGARPKASVVDQHGHLSIAKFPKETDEYSMETWEEIALRLADQAGIATPQHQLIEVAGKAVMLSRRFDRNGAIRIPFLSAMAMMGAKDGERGSYPEIVDALAEHGAQGKTDAHALYRRVVFNVLISNVDDHLRNHGFLWLGNAGWSLSPAYDLNPVPTDLKARVLTTNIDLDEGTCSLDLLEAVNELSVLQHAPWLGRLFCASILRQAGITSGAHLGAINLGLKTIPVDRRRHRDRETRLLAIAHGFLTVAEIGMKEHDRLALARTIFERKLEGRRTSSKLPELVELVMAKPLVSAGMVAKTLDVTPQAARRIVGELGLREMTGRGGLGRGEFYRQRL